MGSLVRAGLVANRRGRSGGYRLARAPATISLLAIIQAVEGDLGRRTCVLRGGPCGTHGTQCAVHAAFARAQDAAVSALGAATLADASDAALA
jgi:Rrf2 family protein